MATVSEMVIRGNTRQIRDANAVHSTDVYNDLDRTTAGKVLDARQGKVLNDKVTACVPKSDIVNDVTTGGTTKVLSAEQGKALNTKFGDYLKTADVYNGLDRTTAGKALDARQGKILNDKATAAEKYNSVMVYTPGATRSTVLTDLDDAESNTTYHFLMATTDTLPDNYPTATRLMTEFLIATFEDTYQGSGYAYQYKLQYLIDPITYLTVARRFYRQHTNEWSDWENVDGEEIERYNYEMVYTPVTTRSTVLTDLNDAEDNTVYHFLMLSTSTLPESYPTNVRKLTEFFVKTMTNYFNDHGSYLKYKIQYIIDPVTGIAVAKRIYIGGTNEWEDWIDCEGNTEIERYHSAMVYSPGQTRSTVLSDLDDAASGVTYHFLMASTNTLPDNYPENARQLTEFFVFTGEDKFTYQGTAYAYKLQYVIDAATNVTVAKRVFNGADDAWETWSVVGSDSKREIIVSADGMGMYTSVTAAVAAAANGDVIYVKKGVYDGEMIKAWNKNITIIGEDKYQTIIKNSYNNYSNPPLEMCIGLLENLTLYAVDGGGAPGQYGYAYGLHIEHNSMANGTFTARNVVFKSDKSNGAGIGLRPGCHAYFEDCEFWSKEQAAIFYHDCATGAVGVQNISFRNCTFMTKQGSYSMRINTQKFSGSTIYNTYINCVVANESGTTPAIDASEGTQYTGDATEPIGDFFDLINFFKGKLSYGNNVDGLNYTSTT